MENEKPTECGSDAMEILSTKLGIPEDEQELNELLTAKTITQTQYYGMKFKWMSNRKQFKEMFGEDTDKQV